MAETNCRDTTCPLAKQCRRATDPPEKNQRYFATTPKWDKGGGDVECNLFLGRQSIEELREDEQERRAEQTREMMRW